MILRFVQPVVRISNVLTLTIVADTRSFAHVACSAPTAYTKPKVLEKGGGNLKFLEARHPCLEVQDDLIFMANDIHMEKGTLSALNMCSSFDLPTYYPGASEFQIISKEPFFIVDLSKGSLNRNCTVAGPNMGGKSTYIRQVGITIAC